MKCANLQDLFLSELESSRVGVTIVTTNGFQMRGVNILAFDNYAIMVRFENRNTLVFKHAISSIIPDDAIKMNLCDSQRQSSASQGIKGARETEKYD